MVIRSDPSYRETIDLTSDYRFAPLVTNAQKLSLLAYAKLLKSEPLTEARLTGHR
ncbi:MAG: hypothetical protein HC780_06890 [Leptolyngbyaceae cyanobacterium CSU_1_3]|nr:hypothetical protein [Leptolyngbyaceae cyanobacterium CSU_1_3]